MSVIEAPAFGVPTSDIAVPAGHIVYVEGMVAESVAFRAGWTVVHADPLQTVTGTE